MQIYAISSDKRDFNETNCSFTLLIFINCIVGKRLKLNGNRMLINCWILVLRRLFKVIQTDGSQDSVNDNIRVTVRAWSPIFKVAFTIISASLQD